jgi:hypothetical protein
MRGFYATPLQLDDGSVSEHLSETNEKYLIAKNTPLARSGYQLYTRGELGIGGDSSEKIAVWRDPAEVFSQKTIFSAEGKTVVGPGHPPVFLVPENTAGYYRGHVQHVREGDPLPNGDRVLIGDLFITDPMLISLIKAKALREISAGYDCEYVEVEDPHSPQAVFAQRNITINHVAVCDKGRAGPSIAIMDAEPSLDSQPEVAKGELSVNLKEFKEACIDFKETLHFFGLPSPGEKAADSLQPVKAGTADADPGSVARNAEKNAEALERAKMRNKDDLPEALKEKAEEKKEEKKESKDGEGGCEKEMKKEEAGAEKPKESKDSGTRDAALDRVVDALDRLSRRMDAAEEKEKEKEKKAEEKKAESEDSELIPVETLAGKDIPKNPIPGAEKHVDQAGVKDALLALKPTVAAMAKADPVRFRDAAVQWNQSWRAACGKSGSNDASYGVIADNKKKPDAVLTADGAGQVQDAGADSANYAEEMRKFNRRHAAEVISEKARVN